MTTLRRSSIDYAFIESRIKQLAQLREKKFQDVDDAHIIRVLFSETCVTSLFTETWYEMSSMCCAILPDASVSVDVDGLSIKYLGSVHKYPHEESKVFWFAHMTSLSARVSFDEYILETKEYAESLLFDYFGYISAIRYLLFDNSKTTLSYYSTVDDLRRSLHVDDQLSLTGDKISPLLSFVVGSVTDRQREIVTVQYDGEIHSVSASHYDRVISSYYQGRLTGGSISKLYEFLPNKITPEILPPVVFTPVPMVCDRSMMTRYEEFDPKQTYFRAAYGVICTMEVVNGIAYFMGDNIMICKRSAPPRFDFSVRGSVDRVRNQFVSYDDLPVAFQVPWCKHISKVDYDSPACIRFDGDEEAIVAYENAVIVSVDHNRIRTPTGFLPLDIYGLDPHFPVCNWVAVHSDTQNNGLRVLIKTDMMPTSTSDLEIYLKKKSPISFNDIATESVFVDTKPELFGHLVNAHADSPNKLTQSYLIRLDNVGSNIAVGRLVKPSLYDISGATSKRLTCEYRVVDPDGCYLTGEQVRYGEGSFMFLAKHNNNRKAAVLFKIRFYLPGMIVESDVFPYCRSRREPVLKTLDNCAPKLSKGSHSLCAAPSASFDLLVGIASSGLYSKTSLLEFDKRLRDAYIFIPWTPPRGEMDDIIRYFGGDLDKARILSEIFPDLQSRFAFVDVSSDEEDSLTVKDEYPLL